MDYSNISLFKLMKAKMAYHSQRQDVLAHNMSNLDTPGYQARDLKPVDFNRMALQESQRLEIKATNPSHLTQGAHGKQGAYRDEKSRKTYESTPVKNSVVLEEQAAKIAENQMEYQKVTNLYGKVSELFKTSIGNRN